MTISLRQRLDSVFGDSFTPEQKDALANSTTTFGDLRSDNPEVLAASRKLLDDARATHHRPFTSTGKLASCYCPSDEVENASAKAALSERKVEVS